jgi:hypothetical protein
MTKSENDEFIAEVSRLIKVALANYPWQPGRKSDAIDQVDRDAEIYDRVDQEANRLEF